MKIPIYTLCVLASFLTTHISAQFNGTTIEVVTVHTGAYMSACGPVDLTGFVTYRLYVNVNPDDCFIGVFGGLSESADVCDGGNDASNMFLNFDGQVFNDPLGSEFANNLLSIFCDQGIYPSICYDSWFALGDPAALTDPFNSSCAGDMNPMNIGWGSSSCIDSFFAGQQLFVDNGGWYLFYQGNPIPEDGKYLIMQITTNGGWLFCGGITIQDNCQSGVVNQELYEFCAEVQSVCALNPLNTAVEVLPGNCISGQAVMATTGGNGEVSYAVFDNLNVEILNGTGNSIDVTLPAGNGYYIALEDAEGCTATTSPFDVMPNLNMPQVQATLVQQSGCMGEANGEIMIECNSNDVAELWLDNLNDNLQPASVVCGVTQTGLGCGNYLITATDANGCSNSDEVNLICPPQVEYNFSAQPDDCAPGCDGSLSASASADVSTMFGIVFQENGPVLFDSQATNAFSVNLNNVCAGNYVLQTIIGNCVYITYAAVLEESAPQVMVISTLFNNGNVQITIEVTGGTAPYSFVWLHPDNSVAGNVQNLNVQGEEGIYTVEVTDANGCTTTTSVLVTYLHDLASHPLLSVYPNPASDQLNVSSGSLKYTDLNISDMNGKIVQTYFNQALPALLDVSQLASGMYQLSATPGNLSARFIKW